MPPCLDVYVLTPDRTQPCLAQFFDSFVDIARLETLSPRELQMLPLDYFGPDDGVDRDHWDTLWVKSSVHALIRVALEQPWRAWSVHLPPRDPFRSSMLATTALGEVVLGISVDDPNGDNSAIEAASELLATLADRTHATDGWAVVEEPPPLTPHIEQPWLSNDVLTSYVADA